MGNPGEPPPYSAIGPPPEQNPGAPKLYPNPNPVYDAGAAPQPQVVLTSPLVLGPGPVRMTCPHCQSQIASSVQRHASSRTHLFALLLCFMCPLGCCFIPYCVDSCQTASHSCPRCGRLIGNYDQ